MVWKRVEIPKSSEARVQGGYLLQGEGNNLFRHPLQELDKSLLPFVLTAIKLVHELWVDSVKGAVLGPWQLIYLPDPDKLKESGAELQIPDFFGKDYVLVYFVVVLSLLSIECRKYEGG